MKAGAYWDWDMRNIQVIVKYCKRGIYNFIEDFYIEKIIWEIV